MIISISNFVGQIQIQIRGEKMQRLVSLKLTSNLPKKLSATPTASTSSFFLCHQNQSQTRFIAHSGRSETTLSSFIAHSWRSQSQTTLSSPLLVALVELFFENPHHKGSRRLKSWFSWDPIRQEEF